MSKTEHPSETHDFTAFKRTLWRAYSHAPHLALIDSALTRITQYVESGGRDGIGRLAIFIPPRHGKSQVVARLFPAWFLGRNPDARVILTGYGASLVEKHSRAVRNWVRSAPYARIFPDVKIASDSAARASWDIADHDGGMDAVGIDGAVTGKGAHLLVIDDPVKNRQQAESSHLRAQIWESYTDDLLTRLEPGGAVALIMTRWHADDLGGRLLAREPDAWHVIRLPALAEDDDPLGRAPGAALWAARYSIETLASRRASMGAYAFAALYQQQPIAREGGLFKFKWIDGARSLSAPPLRRVVIAIDPAASALGGESGIVAAGVSSSLPAHAYILEDASLRGSPDTWARAALALYHKYRAAAIVVEINQGGDMVTHTLHTIDPGARVVPVRAAQGKRLRAEPVAALYEQGRAHHVGVFPALEKQMTDWLPSESTSPDRLDALVWALTDLLLMPSGVGLR
ncbi:MAG: terminase family protein [Chloroflexota bacterium]|nr:terminase family protein [Chloroflexota bacterium]